MSNKAKRLQAVRLKLDIKEEDWFLKPIHEQLDLLAGWEEVIGQRLAREDGNGCRLGPAGELIITHHDEFTVAFCERLKQVEGRNVPKFVPARTLKQLNDDERGALMADLVPGAKARTVAERHNVTLNTVFRLLQNVAKAA